MKDFLPRHSGAVRAMLAAVALAVVSPGSVAQERKNLAYDQPAATILQRLTEHSKKMVMVAAGGTLAGPDILRELPVARLLEGMSVRLDPLKSADVHMTVATQFTDTGRTYALEVRRGVMQRHEALPPKVDVTLHLKVSDLHRIVLRQTTFGDALKAGEIRAEGKTNELARFFDLFDGLATEPPALTAR